MATGQGAAGDQTRRPSTSITGSSCLPAGGGLLAPCRVAKSTAAVQVGARFRAGTTSATALGRKAQCQPSSQTITAQTTRCVPP